MHIYPVHLLPKPTYHIIQNSDLTSLSGLVLIRHIESDEVQKIENTNMIHPDCIKIQSDHLRDLSNNLLGIFKEDDIYYRIKKEHINQYCALWTENTNGLMPSNKKCVRDNDRGYYYIIVDTLLESVIEIDNKSYHFILLHTPTKCNFWHISIRLVNENGLEISTLNINDKQKRKIWKSARDFLILDIIKYNEIISYNTIPMQYYLNT